MPPFVNANPNGARPPIAFVHTWPIEATFLERLAPHLADQPLHAVAYPPEELLRRLNHVVDWVAYQRAHLDDLPVAPPYRLVGWSFGGVVALELARALEADGVAVASVHLVDTWIPRGHPRTVTESFLHSLEHVLSLNRADRPAEIRTIARRVPGQARRLVQKRAASLKRRFGAGEPAPQHQVDPRLRAIWVPFFKYEQTPYHGDAEVTIAACRSSIARNDDDPSLGWSRWLRRGFGTVTVDGDHRSMWTEPHIQVLAEALRQAPGDGCGRGGASPG